MKTKLLSILTLCTGAISLHAQSNVTYTGTGDAYMRLMADSDDSGEGDNPYIYLSQDGDTISGWLGFVGNSGKAPQHGLDYSGTVSNSLLLGTATSHRLQLGTNSTTRLTIDGSGNIGIGTNAPENTLHVHGRVRVDKVGGDTPALIFARANGTESSPTAMAADDWLVYLGSGGHNGSDMVLNKAAIFFKATEAWSPQANGSRITFDTTANGTTTRRRVMTIDQSGMVGIGIDVPTHPLTVNGAIRAKEIIVDTGWADYVFEQGYRLAPLSEVEKHIQENGHLPDVPSAQEVAERGVSLGETQAVLLRKIEELTLHLIAQEKEMAALRQEMSLLRAPASSGQ